MNKFKKCSIILSFVSLMPFAAYAAEEGADSNADYYATYEKCESSVAKAHAKDSDEVRDAAINKCMTDAGFESGGDDVDSSEGSENSEGSY